MCIRDRLFDDGVDAGLVLGTQLGVDILRRLRAIDELLQTGVQLVVEGRRWPVGVEGEAVSLRKDIEVVNQQLAAGDRDVRSLRRDRHATLVAQPSLNVRAHRDVHELCLLYTSPSP